MKRTISCGIMIAAFGLFVLTACSKVSRENYDKLKVGMEYAETEQILGRADNCSEKLGTKSCVWGSDTRNIKVSFVGGKAILFSNMGIQ